MSNLKKVIFWVRAVVGGVLLFTGGALFALMLIALPFAFLSGADNPDPPLNGRYFTIMLSGGAVGLLGLFIYDDKPPPV